MVGGRAFDFRFRVQHDAVAKHGGRQVAHVVRGNIRTSPQHRQALAGQEQHDACPRAGAERQRGQLARAPNDRGDIFQQQRGHHDLPHGGAQFDQLRHAGARFDAERAEPGRVKTGLVPLEDLGLLPLFRIADQDLQQEAVQLCLGQRIRSFIFNRILRGEGGEDGAQRMDLPVHRSLLLLHRLEQGRLGFCRRG